MSMPALQRLREARPADYIALLTSDKTAPLWEHHPAIDEIIPFNKSEGLWTVAKKLRAGRFEQALLLPNSPRSALEVFLAGIPRRTGYARSWRTFLLTQAIRPRPGSVLIRPCGISQINKAIHDNRRIGSGWGEKCHHLFDYLDLVAELGANPAPIAPKIHLTEVELQQAAKLLPESDGSRGRLPYRSESGRAAGWLGLNPGAEYGPAKRWPAERFIATALEVHRNTGCGCLIYGGAQDLALAAEIEAGLRRESGAAVINLAGKTNLRQLCAALTLSRVLLTNDTGPMHIAAAVGVRVVVLFGSTSPELTGPGLPGSRPHVILQAGAVCSPCFRRECPVDLRCLRGITVTQAANAVLRLMS